MFVPLHVYMELPLLLATMAAIGLRYNHNVCAAWMDEPWAVRMLGTLYGSFDAAARKLLAAYQLAPLVEPGAPVSTGQACYATLWFLQWLGIVLLPLVALYAAESFWRWSWHCAMYPRARRLLVHLFTGLLLLLVQVRGQARSSQRESNAHVFAAACMLTCLSRAWGILRPDHMVGPGLMHAS